MGDKLAVRSMYRAPAGKLLCAFDLSAAEAWVVAYLAQDVAMKKILAGGDLHAYAACGIFSKRYIDEDPKSSVTKDERYIGKKMNHACNYRTGPFKIAEFINKEGQMVISVAEAKKFHEAWLRTWSLHRWWGEIDEALQRTRTITTTYGRRRKFWGIWGDDLKKEATAYEPSSTVADHMHGCVHPELGIRGGNLAIYQDIILPSKGEISMCNTAHDSVILEVPRELVDEVVPQVTSLLRRPLIVRGEEFTIPVDAEIGERWGELEKVR